MSERLQSTLERSQKRVEAALQKKLSGSHSPFAQYDSQHHLANLYKAMHYSLFNGGKRVRPLLIYASAEAINNHADPAGLDAIACSMEMIHSYSLVHDDLPAMDDDDLRRGKPTCHKAFDEATAILAGDALQARAFEVLTEIDCGAETRLQLVKQLSLASGPAGMVGGQAMDLAAVNTQIDLEHLQSIHQLKTGALIRAAVSMGATFAGANKVQVAALDDYARAVGLSFQVQDDILDIESDTATLGKQQGADLALNKPTYPALLSLEGAKQKAQDLHQQALSALQSFDDKAGTLRELSAYIINRRH